MSENIKMSKNYAQVEKEHCVACGACMNECPRKAISIWKGCYSTIDIEHCVGCGKCASECPTGCIRILPREVA